MAGITLYSRQQATTTSVPNIFIDEYMTQANGEYVKIYLYILRCLGQPGCDFSLAQVADHFDCTERDIVRALNYWEKHKLFRLEYNDNSELTGIYFNQEAVSGQTTAVNTQEEEEPVDLTNRFIKAAGAEKKPSYSMDEMRSFCEKDDVRELIFITEQYLGRTMNQNDLNTLFFWYDELHFSTDLIEFLIEHCVSKGHTSLHYMQRIAEDFSARGVHTVEEARALFNQDTAIYHAVMKAFGIRGRNLVPSETSFLKTWSQKMGFTAELITEACTRTMNAIHEPSFGYANSILEKWSKQNIHTMDEVKAADTVFAQTQQSKRAKQTSQTGNGRFINFKQRDNNYEELQRQLLRNSMQ